MITNVVSFAGNTFNSAQYEVDFVAGTQPGLPAFQVELLERVGAFPVITALTLKPNRLALLIKIVDLANVDTLRSQLFHWLDPKSAVPQKLVVDSTGGVLQYVMALCEEFRLYSTPRHQQVFVATLVVDGDALWRADTEDSDTWNITASGQTKVITNGGEDDCYPVFQIRPTATKTGGYTYKRWVPIPWLSSNPGPQYPLMASLDTATLVSAGKMQADGDDLRVVANGTQIYRWLDAMNSAATKIWFNLDFAPGQDGTLKTAIAGSGTITAIELNEDISTWPSAGIVLIGTEAFVFTSKDITRNLLSGITRAAKGTSMAVHAIGAAVYWIQHDVWLIYGNSTVSAPLVYDMYKPAFELDHSTNTNWVYEVFGEFAVGFRRGIYVENRAARWRRWGDWTLAGVGGCYTATQRTTATPFTVIGAWIGTYGGNAFGWYLENPCGITNVAWSNGLKRRATTNAGFDFLCHLMYWPRGATWWSWMYTVPSPAVLNTWESWSYSGAAFSASNIVALALYFFTSDAEAGDVTVTLNSAETPTVTVYAEQATYTIAATLSNTTTGEDITIAFECELNQTLEIDTAAKTVTYLKDNSSQFQAIVPLPVRDQWLRLQPGANTLQFDDTGTNGVTITSSWEERYY